MESTQVPLNDNISWHILVGTIITIVPATLCVILRFISRHVSCAGIWWDDYTIAAALVFNWSMAILRWVQIAFYRNGRHFSYVSSGDNENFLKTVLAGQIIYYSNAVLTKASLLLLFHRIFGVVRVFRWALWTSGILVIAYFIACTITAISACSPVAKFWDSSLPGHCIDIVAFFRWNGMANMLLDFLVLCLPLPMTWRVKTTVRQKWILTGLFLLGGLVCVASVLRLVSFEVANLEDPTYTNVDSSAWSSIEQSLGIICACLPTLRPLIRRFSRSSGSSTASAGTSSSDSQSRWSMPVDEESSIIEAATLSSVPPAHLRLVTTQELDILQGSDWTSEFHGDEIRPVSQTSRAVEISSPVSAAESFA
ncbi:uncharacterized protein N7511_004211 [Penicillium nucicola]|uniref:uncharacterized protein n=1 Tax=Penicillium nucicola TaxID=1850975 RepID=UPI002544EE8F|nr:uncharacterized protein N7511_004211 [Penicillium nucicola]KAJ5766595.1 hypothetical protein N7511_004211 [Penicillium nucicola]